MIENGVEGTRVLGLAVNGLVGEAQRIEGTLEQMAEVWLAKIEVGYDGHAMASSRAWNKMVKSRPRAR